MSSLNVNLGYFTLMNYKARCFAKTVHEISKSSDKQRSVATAFGRPGCPSALSERVISF